jgi:hypothetical protein
MKSIGTPDFSKLQTVLLSCSKIVVDEIVKRIYLRVQPDGSPQKNNAETTVKQKGHDHPLIGGEGVSPVLAKSSTYRRRKVRNNAVEITIKPVRRRIAGHVEKKGYEFYGYSDEAKEKVYRRFDAYITLQLKKWVHGIGNG